MSSIKLAFFQNINGKHIGSQLNNIRKCTQKNLCSFSPLPVTKLTEEEEAFRDLAAKVAKEKIAPLVKKMDDEKKMDPTIIKTLFESGVGQY